MSKFRRAFRQRFDALTGSTTESSTSNPRNREDSLCERCASLDFDALYAHILSPFEPISWGSLGLGEVVKLGYLNPGCPLCKVFSHCATGYEFTKDDFASESYQLMKCSVDDILDVHYVKSGTSAVPSNVFVVHPFTHTVFETYMETGKDDLFDRGFVFTM